MLALAAQGLVLTQGANRDSGGALQMARQHRSWSAGRIAANNLGSAVHLAARYDRWADEANNWLRRYGQ